MWEIDVTSSDVAITLKTIDVKVVVRVQRMQDSLSTLNFVLATLTALTECTQIIITPALSVLTFCAHSPSFRDFSVLRVAEDTAGFLALKWVYDRSSWKTNSTSAWLTDTEGETKFAVHAKQRC